LEVEDTNGRAGAKFAKSIKRTGRGVVIIEPKEAAM
jgi:hypothetical protein